MGLVIGSIIVGVVAVIVTTIVVVIKSQEQSQPFVVTLVDKDNKGSITTMNGTNTDGIISINPGPELAPQIQSISYMTKDNELIYSGTGIQHNYIILGELIDGVIPVFDTLSNQHLLTRFEVVETYNTYEMLISF